MSLQAGTPLKFSTLPEFIHLHNHSHYSILDAICTTDGLIDAAIENKMPAVALTDHGVMFGAMEFYTKAKAKGIKPIIGCEAYMITDGSRFERARELPKTDIGMQETTLRLKPEKLTNRKSRYDHLVLLAKNETGYKNLMKMASIGQTEGFYYKPRIDMEVLRKHSEGLVALSACAGGVVAKHIVHGNPDEARRVAIAYKELFGDDFYLEIQNHGIEIEKSILEYMPVLAKELGIKLIATNDVHYIKHEHHIPHNLFLYISTDLSRDKEGRNLEQDLRYGTDQVYFKSADEMCKLFKNFPQAIESTFEVTDKCNLELPKGKYHMPDFPIPKDSGANSLDEYLDVLSNEGLEKKISNITTTERDRLKLELEVIKQMKFSGYFLIVADFVNHAKNTNIMVGPGRGSAAGSLVCYALGITNVNPLEYGLFFERFLNPERVSMPDIDIDFQDDKRDDVINYSKQKYGEKSVSQIITFNKLKTKAVLKDVGRVLNYPFDTINEITKHIPSVFGRVKSLKDCYNDIPEFKQYFDESADRKKLLNYSIVLENLNKNSSMHASGVVIAPSDITDYVPICRTPQMDNVFMTQFDMLMLEKAGLIKMDFLGLKELKILRQAVDLIEKRKGIKIDIENLELSDEKTYELFGNGQTVGIFQFARAKTREYLAKLKPKNINDLVAMNALNRPGPMELIPEFIDRKCGRKEVTYLHPSMEPILKETYGIIVYQEQVMQLVREVAGYTLAKADLVRRAMGKKDEKLMKEQEKEFIDGAVKNSFDKKTAKEIFKLILKFADYGFNKSHSVAYSILAFHTAYLKTHYPLEFMTSLLNCRTDDSEEMVLLINECRKMKIKLSTPDINKCASKFTIDDSEDNKILFGLSSIKNVGHTAVNNIIKERDPNGAFKNFVDFSSRVDTRIVNKKTVESLIFSGAFDNIDSNRRKLFENYEMVMSRFGNKSTSQASGMQSSLFTGGKTATTNILANPNFSVDDWSDREKLSNEKNVLGLYLSSHPLLEFENEVNQLSTFKFGDFAGHEEEIDFSKYAAVRICGIISKLQVKYSKAGNRFAVFTLEDFTGHGECVVFGRSFETVQNHLHNDNIVCVYGKADENGDTIKIVVNDIKPLSVVSGLLKDKYTIETKTDISEKITIRINPKTFDTENLIKLRSLTKKTGNCRIYFELRNNGGAGKLFRADDYSFDLNETIKQKLEEIFGTGNIIIN